MTDIIDVLITLPFSESLIEHLRKISPRINIIVISAKKVDDIPMDIWKKIEVLYTNRILPEPELVPNLRWIQFHWAGVDHALSASIMNIPEIVTTTLSGAASSQVAEYVVMMLLAMGHHLNDMMGSQRRIEWLRDRWERFSPRELRNSVVGLLGYGSIGRQIARLLQPFGTTVLAVKNDVKHPQDEGFFSEGMGDPQGDFVRRLYPPQAMRSMLKLCDFIVVNLPLTPKTRGLIDEKAFATLKPTAYLIDVSRGGIVDQTALISALNENRLAGAALDVFPEEPLPSDNPLWKFPNVFVTPHISGNTPYYDDRAVELFSENLHRYLAGYPLFNQVQKDRGY
jgi:phosphoglycerate dehydrogenase-like enzyme